MIYINYDTNFIKIPRHFHQKTGELQLELINNLTNQHYKIPILDIQMKSLYYNVALDIEELKNLDLCEGEYTYLFGSIEKEVGLLTMGDYKNIYKSYQSDNKKIQYRG